MSFAQLLDPVPIVSAIAGCALGLVYFALLRRTVGMLSHRRSGAAAMSLTLARVGAAAIFFLLVARLGALALLTALGGFLLARTLALRAGSRSG